MPINPKRYNILGVYVDPLTIDQAVAQIIDVAQNKQTAHYVTKPYVEFFARANADPKLAKLLNAGMLCLPDGVSAQWAATYLNGKSSSLWRACKLAACIPLKPHAINQLIPEKFGGATFTWKLLEQCAQRGCSVYLIGSPRHNSVTRTAQVIQAKLPSLRIAGTWPGKLGGLSGAQLEAALESHPVEAELATDLKRERPDIILVGMGFPLQEKLMAKLAPQIKHGVLVGEGGTFDYDSFGGGIRRAPTWMQRSGLEWAWRLGREPKRIKRQLAIPRFMYAVYHQSKRPRP